MKLYVKRIITKNHDDWGKNIIDVAMDIITKQSERVQELEGQRKEDLHDYVNGIVSQNKRYKEVLEFYADERNWREHEVEIIMDGEPTKAYDTPKTLDDGGEKAREALEEKQSEKDTGI